MLAIKGMQKKYAEIALPSSACFCHEKCLWALALGSLCSHGWFLAKENTSLKDLPGMRL